MSCGERWQRETATAFPHTTEIHDIFSYRPPKRFRIPSRGSNRGIHKVATSVYVAYGVPQGRNGMPSFSRSTHYETVSPPTTLRSSRPLQSSATSSNATAGGVSKPPFGSKGRRELAEPARRPRDVRSVSRGSSIYRAVNALVCGTFMTCCVGPRFRLRENCFISDAEAFHCLRQIGWPISVKTSRNPCSCGHHEA